MQVNQLIVFSKVPVEGSVKTRIAKQLGNKKALEIHNRLFKQTLNIIKRGNIPFTVYLNEKPSGFMAFHFKIQQGESLGDKMHNAFGAEFKENDRVCIIGSDCLELTSEDINLGFQQLSKFDIVLGPANDGGYYLIGMKNPHIDLFSNITWGTSSVLDHTIKKCNQLKLSYYLLPAHNDVDRPEDVPAEWL